MEIEAPQTGKLLMFWIGPILSREGPNSWKNIEFHCFLLQCCASAQRQDRHIDGVPQGVTQEYGKQGCVYREDCNIILATAILVFLLFPSLFCPVLVFLKMS